MGGERGESAVLLLLLFFISSMGCAGPFGIGQASRLSVTKRRATNAKQARHSTRTSQHKQADRERETPSSVFKTLCFENAPSSQCVFKTPWLPKNYCLQCFQNTVFARFNTLSKQCFEYTVFSKRPWAFGNPPHCVLKTPLVPWKTK